MGELLCGFTRAENEDLILSRLCSPLPAAPSTWVGRKGRGGCWRWRLPQCRRGGGKAAPGGQVPRGRGAQTAGNPMGCLRVELAGLEVHDPPELQLLLVADRGTSSAQPATQAT